MGHFDDFKEDRKRDPVMQKPSNAQQAAAKKRNDGDVRGGILGLFEEILNFDPIKRDKLQGGLETVGGAIVSPVSAAVEGLRDAGVTGENFQRGLGNIVAGNPQFFQGGPTQTQQPTGPTPEETERAALEAADKTFREIEDLKVLEQENLTPEGQAALAKFREQKEQELSDLNRQIATLNMRAQLQHEYAGEITTQAFPEGLIPGADPEATRQLNELLDSAMVGGTGGTAPELQGIIDSIVDSNLPESEKSKRLGWIVDQSQMRSELQGAIDSLVTDREAVETLLSLPDSELLADPSLFAQPQLNVDVQFDPLGRTQVALLEEVEGVLEQQFGEDIPTEIVNALTNQNGEGILDLVAQGVLDPASEQFMQVVQQRLPGVNPAQIQSAINQGMQVAAVRHEAWNNALEQTQYTPGSIELVYALFQAALGAGFDEVTAGQIAEDRNIHHVIDVYSDGQVGAEGTGGRQGLGMLTPEAYNRLGIPMDGTPESELMALVMYMMEAGNPAVRLQTFFDTGVWGN